MTSFAYPKRFDEPFDTGERIFEQTYLLYASAGAFHLDVEERSWLLPPHLAMSDDQVVQIAHEAGFSSASMFAQAFRQIMGETPTSYRRRHK